MEIDFLAKNPMLSPLVNEYASLVFPNADAKMCSCCKRSGTDLIGLASEEYSTEVWHCSSCHLLFHGSLELLGKESDRGAGVAYKLGMMAGCAIYVDSNSVELYAPGKHFPKLAHDNSLFAGHIHDLGGKHAIKDMIERYRTDKPERALLISNLGKKKAGLVKALTFTESSSIALCTDDGSITFELSDYDFFSALELCDKKVAKVIKEGLSDMAYGRLERQDLSGFFEALEQAGLTDQYFQLTPDAHLRLRLMSILK